MAEARKNHSSIGIKISVGGSEISGLTDIPDLGATPEKLDVTTLIDGERHYIDGVKDYGDLEFNFIYDETNFASLKAMEGDGEKEVIVTFPDNTKFTFSGAISVRMLGVGVNAVITFAMSVALSTEIKYN